MDEDFALICAECGTVTIFQIDASLPHCCARCGSVLHDDVPLEERTRSSIVEEELNRWIQVARATYVDASFRRP